MDKVEVWNTQGITDTKAHKGVFQLAGGTIGINIRGQGLSNENVAHYIIHELKPRAVVVINESKLAEMLVPYVPIVLFRMKDTIGIKDDDSAYAKHESVQFVNALHNLAPAGCYLYLGNEFGSSKLADQDWWTYHAVQRCKELGRKPAVHAQYTHHFHQGAAGWEAQRRSVEAAIAIGGVVIPHTYYFPTISDELKRRPRNGFMVLEELRATFGWDFEIVISEFSYMHHDNARVGPVGILSDDRFADDTEQAAVICEQYGAVLCVYGFFQHGSEWDSFNMWFRERYKFRIAEFNRRQPVTQVNYGTLVPLGRVKLKNMGGATQLRVRRLPSATATQIGVLIDGNELPHWSQPSGGWWKVKWVDGTEGYASAQYLDFVPVVVVPDPPAPELPDFPSNIEEAMNMRYILKALETNGEDFARHASEFKVSMSFLVAILDQWIARATDSEV